MNQKIIEKLSKIAKILPKYNDISGGGNSDYSEYWKLIDNLIFNDLELLKYYVEGFQFFTDDNNSKVKFIEDESGFTISAKGLKIDDEKTYPAILENSQNFQHYKTWIEEMMYQVIEEQRERTNSRIIEEETPRYAEWKIQAFEIPSSDDGYNWVIKAKNPKSKKWDRFFEVENGRNIRNMLKEYLIEFRDVKYFVYEWKKKYILNPNSSYKKTMAKIFQGENNE